MKRTVIRVSSDLVAHAVIAAACSYGDDPVRALTGDGYAARRALTAAASGLARELNLPLTRVGLMLGLSASVVGTARAKNRPGFADAERAAAWAVREGATPVAIAVARTKARTAPTAKPAIRSAGAVRREVLVCLEEDPSNVAELAQLVGVSEAAIREAISVLQAQGRVTCGPRAQTDWRARTWRLAPAAVTQRAARPQLQQGEALQ